MAAIVCAPEVCVPEKTKLLPVLVMVTPVSMVIVEDPVMNDER